jgi:hypothetical protein
LENENYLDFFIRNDITYCISDCDNLECFRNEKHIKGKPGVYSMADFMASGECPVYSVNSSQNEKK